MPRQVRDIYFVLFVIQFAFGAALVIQGEVVNNEADGFLGSVRVIMLGLGQMALGSAASSIAITEIGRFMVVLSRGLEQWVNRLKEERLAMKEERLARMEKRREEGRAEERAIWEAWNQRRLDAEADGRPFHEPPPSANGRNGGVAG